MSDPVFLALPAPISTNNLFINIGRGRATSEDYAKWQREARQMIGLQHPRQFVGPADVTIFAGEAGVGRMDADNAAKACLDMLVSMGVLADDSRRHVRSVSTIWTEGLRGCVVRIEAAAPSPRAAGLVADLPPAARALVEVKT